MNQNRNCFLNNSAAHEQTDKINDITNLESSFLFNTSSSFQ